MRPLIESDGRFIKTILYVSSKQKYDNIKYAKKFTISLKSKNKKPTTSSGGNIALAIGFLLERPEAVENLFIEPRLTIDNLSNYAK